VRQHARPVFLAIALSLLVAGLAATPSQSRPTSSQIDLAARFKLLGDPAVPCPAGSPAGLMCPLRTGVGSAPGLGAVTEAYTFLHWVGPPKCEGDTAQALAYPVRWVVANKGELNFALAESICISDGAGGIGSVGQAFTITGGTGIYAGASGSGRVKAGVGLGSDGKFHGSQTWTGTLSVPGHDFDVTAPVLRGAVNKTVKARKGSRGARVTFHVTAQDAKDGALPASCDPRSGSRFPIGRTLVECAATDSSANTATASFRITVRRPK